jgi:hypothetical protein
MFFLPPDVVAFDPELPALPAWLKLGLVGAVMFVTALALTLG